MKTLSTLFTLVVVVVLFPKTAAAWQQASENKEGASEGMVEGMVDLSLTEDQETKLADLRKEMRPKIEEAAKELAGLVKDEVDKVREVLTADQREKVKSLIEERREKRPERMVARIAHLKDLELSDAERAQFEEIREEYRPKVEKMMKELSGVLTDEQKKTREEGMKAGKSRRDIRQSLNLTAEQREKVDSIGKELVSVVRDELEKMKSVLTTAQQEKLEEFKTERRDRARDRVACAIVNFKDLDLTDEQKSKIAAIREEYRPKIHEAGNKLRAAVRDVVAQVAEIVRS
jgi:Spy/CpxP family protein refolding chaperone